MKDKQKIIAEIERRMTDNLAAEGKANTGHFGAAAKEDYEIIGIIESLPGEKPSEDLQKAAGEYIAPWLDKAYEKYGLPRQKSLSKFDAYAMEEAFEAGAQWQKEQMMKGAVEGEVQGRGEFINFGDDKYIDLDPTMQLRPVFEVKDGERVKLIIVKEDEK